MRHPEPWYAKLAHDLGHDGYVTLAEVRQQEARDCRQLADVARWTRRGASYHLDLDGFYYVVGHEPGKRTWQIQAWPAGGPVRTQGGIETMRDARSLALAMPCARCGLANHLPLMVQRLPARPSLASDPGERWRCMDTTPCEAERKRLTDTEDDPPARIEIRQPAPGQRLEHLRASLRAENISYGELIELQSLAPHISPGDTELLEAAGVPEHPES